MSEPSLRVQIRRAWPICKPRIEWTTYRENSEVKEDQDDCIYNIIIAY